MPQLATALQLCLLLAASVGTALLLKAWLSASAWLVAAMLTAMCFGLAGSKLRIKPWLMAIAQGMTGVAIASTLDIHGLLKAAANGWAFVAVLLTVGSAIAVGWVMLRFASLSGTTAVWGSLPGAASVMGSLAMVNGGDGVLVSLMQYLRVVLVVAIAPLVAHSLGATSPIAVGSLPKAVATMQGHHAIGFGLAIAICLLGCWIATRFNILAGAFLVPLLLGSVYTGTSPIALHVPSPVLSGGFTILGWAIGLQFRREFAITMVRSVPAMLVATLAMLGVCALWAWLLARLSPISFLTAYLATTPGGLDSVVAIAMGTTADLNFVVAVQTMRVFVVLFVGPFVARLLGRTKSACGPQNGKVDRGSGAG